jgi:multidrug resistance efflux pump
MDDPRILGPIPTPPAQRWREIRLLYLPRITFVVGLLVAGWLWVSSVAPATMVGEAEVQQVEVRAAQAGVLASLKVELLQTVRAGEVVGHMAQANPRLLDATLAVIRADVAMLSATMAGRQTARRTPLNSKKCRWTG